MNKPDWFKLTENDETSPYVGNRIPFGVSLLLVLGIAALVFLFPSKTEVQPSTNTVEIIVEETTPPSITNPMTKPTNNEEDDDEDDEDSED